MLIGFYNSPKNPEKLRKVAINDAKKESAFVYLLNNFKVPP